MIKPLVLAALIPALLLVPAPSRAGDATSCVTQTLSLIAYYRAPEASAGIVGNLEPPPPPPPPAPEPPGGSPSPPPKPARPVPAPCPTLYLAAADARARAACEMADNLPGARCVRQWSGWSLLVEPFD